MEPKRNPIRICPYKPGYWVFLKSHLKVALCLILTTRGQYMSKFCNFLEAQYVWWRPVTHNDWVPFKMWLKEMAQSTPFANDSPNVNIYEPKWVWLSPSVNKLSVLQGEAAWVCWEHLFFISSPGNDCTQQCDRPAAPLSPQTQNYCPTSKLESGSGPWRQDLLLPHCHKVGIAVRLWTVCLCLWKPTRTSYIASLCILDKRSGTLQPGKEAARTLVWTTNRRWTWEHPPTMRILPRSALGSEHECV